MAYAIDPLIATATRRLHLAVETESELTPWMVVMDLLKFTDPPPNALVVTAATGSASSTCCAPQSRRRPRPVRLITLGSRESRHRVGSWSGRRPGTTRCSSMSASPSAR